jgi:hypothetical protein
MFLDLYKYIIELCRGPDEISALCIYYFLAWGAELKNFPTKAIEKEEAV